ncbi:MAG: hypothetical protein IT537_15320 [Hyphomicrobiales bacterium]|nr:hypothetical protein [Hyphomicrobiales bacterium]
MGIFPENANVDKIPGMLPRLGFYIRTHVKPTADVKHIAGSIRFPNGSEHHLGSFDADSIKKAQGASRENGNPWTGSIIASLATNMPMEEAGLFQLVARIDDEEIVCGALHVRETGDEP